MQLRFSHSIRHIWLVLAVGMSTLIGAGNASALLASSKPTTPEIQVIRSSAKSSKGTVDVTVSFSIPSANASSPILQTQVKVGAKTCTANRKVSKCTVKGVIAGKTYKVLVRAKNRIGYSTWSSNISFVANTRSSWMRSVATTTTTIPLWLDGGNCSKVGDKSTINGGYLECRKISSGTNNWFKLSSNPAAVSVPVGGDSLDACKLREARINKFQAWNIGFPRGEPSGWNPVSPTGNSRVQLIAIDFEDVPGSSKQLEEADGLIQKFNEWFRFFSNEKKDFTWQFPKQWIRMSKKSTDYQYTVNDTGPNSIQREIIQTADPLINFSNSDFTFVLLPQTIEAFDDGIAMVGRSINSDEGEIRNIVGAGSWTYRNGYPGGPSIHEILHPMGLAGHAPRGADNHAMDTGSDVLNLWDAFLLGWIESDELFCMPITMNLFEGSLIPLERKQHGFRGVIVPLSSTEALVVQSHRAENWGVHLDPGTYGLAVYYVDTTKDVDRTDEGKGIVNETWSKYVGGETRYKRLLLVGDTATYKNIKVELLKSGDNDLVRIVKS